MARLLALLAVVAQLFTPVVALPPVPAVDGFAALLGAGLICHGTDGEQPREPGPADSPLSSHKNHALCCILHGGASPLLPTPFAVAPVAFQRTTAFAEPVSFLLETRPEGTVRARAPPIAS
jgi:hypothetical protein